VRLRAFFSELSRGELVLCAVLGVSLVVFAIAGPGGAAAGFGAAIVVGLVAGLAIGVNRIRAPGRAVAAPPKEQRASRRAAGRRRKHGRR